MSDMTDQMPEDELLAAEIALGVLAGAAREAAERRIARDRGFALMVAAWEERLASVQPAGADGSRFRSGNWSHKWTPKMASSARAPT